MSETETETPPVERVVPEGMDLFDDLRVVELDAIARQLKCDVMAAIEGRGPEGQHRVKALALLAHTWAKRSDKGALLSTFLNMRAGDLGTVLGMDDHDGSEGDPVPPTPDATASD